MKTVIRESPETGRLITRRVYEAPPSPTVDGHPVGSVEALRLVAPPDGSEWTVDLVGSAGAVRLLLGSMRSEDGRAAPRRVLRELRQLRVMLPTLRRTDLARDVIGPEDEPEAIAWTWPPGAAPRPPAVVLDWRASTVPTEPTGGDCDIPF